MVKYLNPLNIDFTPETHNYTFISSDFQRLD